jgi:hypothetical protein
MARYLKKGVEWAEEKGEKKGPERKVRAFIDLHSYGQLCKSYISLDSLFGRLLEEQTVG